MLDKTDLNLWPVRFSSFRVHYDRSMRVLVCVVRTLWLKQQFSIRSWRKVTLLLQYYLMERWEGKCGGRGEERGGGSERRKRKKEGRKRRRGRMNRREGVHEGEDMREKIDKEEEREEE